MSSVGIIFIMDEITAEDFPINAKVYQSAESGMMSIVDMFAYFEKYGAMRVSDLHIKIGVQPAYRIDGSLVKLKGAAVTPDIARSLVYPLLSDVSREKLQTNQSVDCSYHYHAIHFRINVFKENDGISAAIRALSRDIPKVEDIGFPNDVWKDIINLKSGLVLMTGITGAGKSTTIASFIDRIASNRACRIITVEDPIEYVFTQKNSIISQREIGRDVKSFQDGLRSMLREDPDIIFVGEMRDTETIGMTLMAAETGHLVFSTLHTRDATGTITRILDYFTGDRQQEVQNQLSLSLAYVICQKLIPKKDATGRLVAMEILNNTYAVANLIRIGKVEQLYTQLQTKTQNTPEGKMITLEQHLAKLVKAGKVDLREAQKWANDVKCFVDFMNSE
jgi:twitching motility protein PilT